MSHEDGKITSQEDDNPNSDFALKRTVDPDRQVHFLTRSVILMKHEHRYLASKFNEDLSDVVCIIDQFMLNKDQRHAFLLVSLHLSNPDIGQLSMFLGGMAGTGKSCVIHAI